MYIPKQLSRISEKIHSGHRVNRIRVRDLLRMFGAERRGQNKVQEIRDALVALNLETRPDFESIWIDGYIRIMSSTLHDATIDDDTENGCVDEDIDQASDDDEADEARIGGTCSESVVSVIAVPETTDPLQV